MRVARQHSVGIATDDLDAQDKTIYPWADLLEKEVIRIISARYALKHERQRYESETH